ncbi:hypothetical protein HMN09_00572700 [Mycena chlorophos]|uniref:Uncharacterized protein n=1 Tax=Mycena chlorophos TaxID=658473 RepID=A0A8H6T8K5_MYCCL|nr:hypothetical protein HMN09_00572700 [Mycena chlorophos]
MQPTMSSSSAATRSAAPPAPAPTVPCAQTQAQSPAIRVPLNHNGPQCCHCGWRGGEHAKSCLFNPKGC